MHANYGRAAKYRRTHKVREVHKPTAEQPPPPPVYDALHDALEQMNRAMKALDADTQTYAVAVFELDACLYALVDSLHRYWAIQGQVLEAFERAQASGMKEPPDVEALLIGEAESLYGGVASVSV